MYNAGFNLSSVHLSIRQIKYQIHKEGYFVLNGWKKNIAWNRKKNADYQPFVRDSYIDIPGLFS